MTRITGQEGKCPATRKERENEDIVLALGPVGTMFSCLYVEPSKPQGRAVKLSGVEEGQNLGPL